jgi:hypothetical protein
MTEGIYESIATKTTRAGHTGPVGRSAAVAALVAALAWSGAASGGTSKPALRLLDRQPVTLRGWGFKERERVRVTVVANRTFVRTVRTTAAGTFRVTFDGAFLSSDRCGNGWTITARGARGDAATLKLPQPECPPQPEP